MRRRGLLNLAALASLALGTVPLATPAAALATVRVTVNTFADISADPPGPNSPDCNDPCSLRKAVQFANSQSTGTLTVITVPAGTYTLTIRPEEDATFDDSRAGDLHVVRQLEIVGAGASRTIIEQGPRVQDRVFTISGNARISGVTIRNGKPVPGDPTYPGSSGGGILVDGGALELSEAVVTHNRAILGETDPALQTYGGFGGGIAVLPNFSSGNRPTVLHEVTLSDNSADVGGAGISANGGEVIVVNSTINGNHCLPGCQGGGLYAATLVRMINDTVDGNSADQGGGLYSDDGSAALTNVTLSANTINARLGTNARHARASAVPAPLNGAALYANSTYRFPSVRLANTVINGTPLDECGQSAPDPAASAVPALVSEGSNIEDGLTCGLVGRGDRPATDARLGPLADNGGSTRTRAIGPGSPALDAVQNPCPPPSRDQRGTRRASPADRTGSACDIGAYEYQAPAPPVVPPAPTTTTVVRDVVVFVPYIPPPPPSLPRAGHPPEAVNQAAHSEAIPALFLALVTVALWLAYDMARRNLRGDN